MFKESVLFFFLFSLFLLDVFVGKVHGVHFIFFIFFKCKRNVLGARFFTSIIIQYTIIADESEQVDGINYYSINYYSMTT